MRQVTILGAGISGLSASYHVGHERSAIYEAKTYHGGHIRSVTRDGFTWDEGPHVSFNANEYVRTLFAESVGGEFEEVTPVVSNYYQGHWIDHPAQSNLYQVPEPLRTQCLESFLEVRARGEQKKPVNYQEWIDQAFGPVFASTFPAAYTRKYWTTEPVNLTTDWIGARVFYPAVEDVKGGFSGPLGRSTYWVNKARYPSRGGFGAYAEVFAKGARIQYSKALEWISFGKRMVGFSDGALERYDDLVSTLPLPVLIGCSDDAPPDVRAAAAKLRASNLYLVEVAARHRSVRKDPWLYVYDEDKLSTRVTIMENFSPHNAPPDSTALLVEVYGSAYRPLPADRGEVARRVQQELLEMGLLESLDAVTSVRLRFVPWGQVIYDHNRQPALDVVNAFLDRVGVVRAGRYAEWGYLMTDNCVLSGRRAGERLGGGRG